ncbi:MAG: DEAD/DEAH box helicase, partial [Gemmatimonadales bacterium]
EPFVEVYRRRRGTGLVVSRETIYFGFVLDRERRPLRGAFPPELEGRARDALAQALLEGETPHPSQNAIARAVRQLDEYWRRSGGRLEAASPERIRDEIRRQLDGVTSWESFLETRIRLDPARLVPAGTRAELDRLPSSAAVLGDTTSLRYDLENGTPVVRLALREKQARRLREAELPRTDRPLRFSVYRGRREVARAASLGELMAALQALDERRARRRQSRRRRAT